MDLRIRIDKTVKSGRLAEGRNCNLNCIWCHSDYFIHSGFIAISNLAIISCVTRVIGFYKGKNVSIRIAGAGDPTLVGADELCDLISKLRKIPEVKHVKLTTNGVIVSSMIDEIYDAGLDGVSVSLNSTMRSGFIKYAQADKLDKVLEGIKSVALKGVDYKINAIYSNINKNEIRSYLDLSRELGNAPIKFFDLIPTPKSKNQFLSLNLLENKLSNMCETISEQLTPYPTRSYFMEDGSRIDVKIAGKINLCPNINCESREICLEGCRHSIRIGLDGMLRPCGVRNDNMVDLLSAVTTDKMIWDSLHSGGKIGWD